MAQVVRVCLPPSNTNYGSSYAIDETPRTLGRNYGYGSPYAIDETPRILGRTYGYGSPYAIDETPRILGRKFKNPTWDHTSLDVGYGGQISKKQNTGSSNFTLESFGIDSNLLSQLITNLQQTKETVSVKEEKTESKNTKQGDVDYWFNLSKGIRERNDLYQEQKLSLVLDLDHTLLHSVKFDEIDSMQEQMLRKEEKRDRQRPQRHLFCLPYLKLWTKLRPGIWTFLKQASKLYKLHICTMGNQIYATEIAKLLYPTGELFGGRVMSKCGNATKDLVGVLGMESTAVIMDDTVQVWPEHRMNLIHMDKYTYFHCNGKSSLLDLGCDERAEDGILASSLTVIQRIHTNFFSNPLYTLDEVDVRDILAAEKCKVLEGCHILFSSIFPMEEPNPEKHPLWLTAQQFGAICTTQMDSRVTHVVANKIGAQKVNWAFATGRFVVSPKWIKMSMFCFRKAHENKFPVN